MDIAPSRELVDRMLVITENSVVQFTMGPKGDVTFIFIRLIPVDSSNPNDESTRYRLAFYYSYPSEKNEKHEDWTHKDDELYVPKFPDDESLMKCSMMLKKGLRKIGLKGN